MITGVLLLAAGQGRRFGSDKRFATLADGRTLLETTLDALVDSGLPVLTCLPAGDARAKDLLSAKEQACIALPESNRGMGSTLAGGIAALPSHWQGVLIALADMPTIQSATYRLVAEALLPGRIVVPQLGGRRGHPVAFARCWFDELAALEGDSGARRLLLEHAQQIDLLSVADAGIHYDVDRPEDI